MTGKSTQHRNLQRAAEGGSAAVSSCGVGPGGRGERDFPVAFDGDSARYQGSSRIRVGKERAHSANLGGTAGNYSSCPFVGTGAFGFPPVYGKIIFGGSNSWKPYNLNANQ